MQLQFAVAGLGREAAFVGRHDAINDGEAQASARSAGMVSAAMATHQLLQMARFQT